MSRTTWGIFLIVVAFGILAFVAYKNSPKRRVPIIFSPRNEILSLWEDYKKEYFEQGTNRVLDKQKNNITTSEGESYAMLRAVWLDDKATFDSSWSWTKNNLQRQDNHLFSWLFGEQSNGSYGILTSQGGRNTASDADSDIALSLVFASSRWNDASYLADAKTIIGSIWENEVVMIKGVPYLTSDNLEKTASTTTVVINPSYLSPYAYRIFAKIDPDHPWNKLVDSSYDILEKSMNSNLNATSSVHIPPDWILMNKKTGAITASTDPTLTTNMGFDALRVPWRLTLDWQWNQEPRAKQLLQHMSFLGDQWDENSLLYTTYSHDGQPVQKTQSAAFYGGTLGYFMVTDPTTAKTIYDNKLQVLFDPDSNDWKVKLGYYDANWAWFGIALYNGFLTNLAAS